MDLVNQNEELGTFCSAMRLSGRDRGLMVQQQQTATKRTAADSTALRSVRLFLPSLNKLAARGSSDPWWGGKNEGPARDRYVAES